jgi:hypothetical protein
MLVTFSEGAAAAAVPIIRAAAASVVQILTLNSVSLGSLAWT